MSTAGTYIVLTACGDEPKYLYVNNVCVLFLGLVAGRQYFYRVTALRLQRYIAILSVVLFAGKLWAWYLTKSVTVLTDALESTVNVIAGLVGLYSVILSAKPRDANHPYGHGKVEFISAAVEGALIIAASLMICYEAIFQLIHPSQLNRLDIGIVIISITAVANFLLGKYAVATGKKQRSLIVESAGRHLCSDAYSTIAIVAGLLLVMLTHWQWLDAVVALVFSGIIFMTGYKVLRRSLAGIMDEADMELLESVVKMLQECRRDQWIDLHNLRVIQYGDILHIDAHMTLPYYFEVRQSEAELHTLEDLVRERFGSKVEMFIHVDGCAPYQCKLCSMEQCPVRQTPFREHITWNLDNVMTDSKHGKELTAAASS